jgi:hypothetical protein
MYMNTAMSNETGTKPALQRKSPYRVHGQLLLLMGLAVLLAIVAIGGYAFHWAWTGFQGNTLWDWLKLLFLPVVLSSAKLSFKDHRDAWFRIAIGASLFLLLTAIGGYAFHWTWTGFQGNTLWDWLVLLLLPVALVVAKLAYAEYQGHKKAMENAQQASLPS